jgi:hypothetical protein
MPLLFLVLLLQGVPDKGVPDNRQVERPIDGDYAIAVVRTLLRSNQSTLHLRLIDRNNRNRFWDLETLPRPELNCEIVRSDGTSVVLGYTTDYGISEGFVKYYFEASAKRVVKRIEFKDTSFGQIADVEVQRVLGVSREFARELKAEFMPELAPDDLIDADLPQSTYAEFARARPRRVQDGYGPDSEIQERIEGFQAAGGRIWIGKSFYDGEGLTGVGGIGYFDRSTKKFTFLRIPEVVDWSVGALLVEGDTLWAALVRHPEGATFSGGLIRHDLNSGRTQKLEVDDVIYKIVRKQDALYVTTDNGIYVLKNEKFIRYRVEPDMNGKPTIVSGTN